MRYTAVYFIFGYTNTDEYACCLNVQVILQFIFSRKNSAKKENEQQQRKQKNQYFNGPNRILTYYLSSLWHNFKQRIKIKLNEPNIYDYQADLNTRL